MDYPKGIRENGGQYTHAAMWAISAFAKLGLFSVFSKYLFKIINLRE